MKKTERKKKATGATATPPPLTDTTTGKLY